MTNPKSNIRIFDNLESLSRAATKLFIETSAQVISERGRFLVALSGGNTPSELYKSLAQSPYKEQIDWTHVHVFWGDERCVPIEDLENNYRQAYDALLKQCPDSNRKYSSRRIRPRACEAAKDYANILNHFASPPLDWPRFDLALLGMGEDGHTASLFPGSEVNVSSPTLAVTASYQDRPANRVTLTPLVFNAAHRIIFLVSGESKAQTLANVLYGGYDPEQLPAQRIRPTDGELIWMVDKLRQSNSRIIF